MKSQQNQPCKNLCRRLAAVVVAAFAMLALGTQRLEAQEPTYDLLIVGGHILNGSGSPWFEGSVAVKDGKIAAIGATPGSARQTIEARGRVVSPGFVDIHTHYDAQVLWDRMMTISPWHGVTTVVMGNCGVGIAPCRPEAREIAMRDLVNVEAIPFEVDPFRKHCLLNGLDDIGLTLQHVDEIKAYEARRRQEAPWLFAE